MSKEFNLTRGKEVKEIIASRFMPLDKAIYLEGDIQEGISPSLISAMEAKAKTGLVEVHLTSDGGDPRLALMLIQHFRRLEEQYKCKIRTIAAGYTNSAGTLMAFAGTKGERLALSGTEFLIHDMGVHIEAPFEQARQNMHEGRVIKRRMATFLSEATGQSFKDMYQILKGHHALTDKQALALGGIDRIVKL